MSIFRLSVQSVLAVAAVVALTMQLLRWVRVLQREHYLVGSVSRFYGRWFATTLRLGERAGTARSARVVLVLSVGLGALGILNAFSLDAVAASLATAYGLFFPPQLAVRGRTSPLSWTRRLRTVAVLAAVLVLAAGALAALWRPWVAPTFAIVAVPLAVEVAAWITRPYEELLARRYVREAQRRLERVHPRVVAITGSFGKTSTKHHLAELLGGRHGVVPTPRSYNNRAGLSRAINENVNDDTKIFIAEMGTYGPGEIADLCSWCPPEIAVITAIGPVHLERMGSLATIEQAKFEITERAVHVVVNIDDERLTTWVNKLEASGKQVTTAGSTNDDAQVRVVLTGERWHVSRNGAVLAVAPPVIGVHEVNLACAIAAAGVLGVADDEIVARLAHVSVVPNRMVVATAPSGVMVIDDTFNANPAGAASALATLTTLPVNGRHVVVTPGMVELGREQDAANEQLGCEVAALGAELVIVGRTNAAALREGFGDAARHFATRDEAVEWVRASLSTGDGVLYLNDLPDHYP